MGTVFKGMFSQRRGGAGERGCRVEFIRPASGERPNEFGPTARSARGSLKIVGIKLTVTLIPATA